MKPPLRDRIGLRLLIPSVIVPVAAIALALWRSTNVDDGHEVIEVGLGLFYWVFAVFLVVAAVSMLVNAVVFVSSGFARTHSAIPFQMLWPHYAATLTIAAWAALYTFVPLGGLSELIAPPAIMVLSIMSFLRAVALLRLTPNSRTPTD